MSEVSSHKQDDMLTEYGTATTAYLLMAMSIDSLERKNRQLEAENAKLRELVESYGMIANEAVCDYYDRDEMLAEANATAHDMGIEVGV